MASDNTPVARLIHQCCRTDSGPAWEELVRRFGNVIREAVYDATHVLEVARCHDLRQELVQEVYCRLLEDRRRYLRRFRGSSETEARTFFARVARSVVHTHARRLRAQKRGGAQDPAKLVACGAATGMIYPNPSPELRLLRREKLRTFWARAREALGDDPAGRRKLSILRLATVEGFTHQEISHRIRGALRPTGVGSLIFRVRRQLGIPSQRRTAARG